MQKQQNVYLMYFHPSEMISFSLQGDVKLAKFGLYHMTDHGADVDFPVGYVTSFPFVTGRLLPLFVWNFLCLFVLSHII